MKICPICGKQYQKEMNFCLDDGSLLEDLVKYNQGKTLSMPFIKATDPQNEPKTDSDRSQRAPEVLPAPKSSKGLIAASVIIGLSILGGFLVYGMLNRTASPNTNENSSVAVKNISVTTSNSIRREPQKPKEGKLDIKIEDRVRGGFDSLFLRCKVTNVGETIIKDPSVKLIFYKNDVKLGESYGDSELEFLKPGQSIPVWVQLSQEQESYTSVKIDETNTQSIVEKDPARFFVNPKFADVKMTSEKSTSLVNFKPFPETFYTVAGTIENTAEEKLDPKIFVVFYNDRSEVVGVASTSPSELEKGEKTNFEASVSRTRIFGVPTKYEIITVNEQ